MAKTQVPAKQIAGNLVAANMDPTIKDGTAATPSLRTLGPGAQQTSAGNQLQGKTLNLATPSDGDIAIYRSGGAPGWYAISLTDFLSFLLQNPGDTIIVDASSQITVLPAGSTGQIYTIGPDGIPYWQ